MRAERDATVDELEEAQRKLAHMIAYAQQLEAKVERCEAAINETLKRGWTFSRWEWVTHVVAPLREWALAELKKEVADGS